VGDRDHGALLAALDRTRLQAIHGQRVMTAPAMGVPEVGGEQATQVAFVQHHEIIQALPDEYSRSAARQKETATDGGAR
jgi:hypothetical protein